MRIALLLIPPKDVVIVAEDSKDVGIVVIGKVVEITPAGTVTEAGSEVRATFEVARLTT